MCHSACIEARELLVLFWPLTSLRKVSLISVVVLCTPGYLAGKLPDSSPVSSQPPHLAVGMMELQMCTTFGVLHAFWELNLGCQAFEANDYMY